MLVMNRGSIVESGTPDAVIVGINGRNGLPQPCSKPQLILLRSLSLTAQQSFLPANFWIGVAPYAS